MGRIPPPPPPRPPASDDPGRGPYLHSVRCSTDPCHACVEREAARQPRRTVEELWAEYQATTPPELRGLVADVAAPGAVPTVRVIRCHCPPGAWPCECD